MSEAGTQGAVAVYRDSLLPPSETFILKQALPLERYRAIFVGRVREDGLELPPDRVVLGAPGGRWRRALDRRLPGDPAVRRLVRGCRRHRVQLVHAHFGPDAVAALPVARSLGAPLVVTYWGYDATMTDEALIAAGGYLADYVRLRSELFEQAALIIAVSRFVADELRRQGAPDDKLCVHHGGVALGPPPDGAARPAEVLFVGRHVDKKGLGDLVEAMAQVQAVVAGARLVVVGDGPLRARYEGRAGELGLHAEFVGWLPPESVRERLRRARALCVPSRRAPNGDAEGLPTVIPEAGAEGLPVVGTRHSGIPEAVIDGRTGLLADEGDVDGIAQRLISVLSDDDLWRRLSAGAHDNVRRNFSPERQTAALEGLYDRALSHG